MLLFFYIIIILVLNVVPIGGNLNTTTVGPLRADYLLHTILFLPWMPLVCRRIERTPGGWRLKGKRLTPGGCLLWMTLGIGLALGVEAMQHLVAERTFNVMDGVFNGVGVVLGGVGALGSMKFEIRKKSSNSKDIKASTKFEIRNSKQGSKFK